MEFILKDAKELLQSQFNVLVSSMTENLLCQNWDYEGKKVTFSKLFDIAVKDKNSQVLTRKYY